MSTAQNKISEEIEEQIFTSAISPNHAYRKLNRLIDFEAIAAPLAKLYSPHLFLEGENGDLNRIRRQSLFGIRGIFILLRGNLLC